MTALLLVMRVWGGRLPWLLAGLVLAVASVAAGVGLLAASGAALADRSAPDLAGLALLGFGLPATVRMLGVSRVVLRYLERLLTHAATFRALADLRVWLFRGMTAGAAGGLAYRRSGDLIARLVADVEALDGLYLRILVPWSGAVLLLPVLVLVLLPLGAGVVFATAGLFVLAAFGLPVLAARAAMARGARLAAAGAALRVGVLDAVGHLAEVRAFGAEGRMLAAVQAQEADLFRAQRDLAAAASAMDAVSLLCAQAGTVAVLVGSGSGSAAAIVAVFLTIAAFDAVSGLPRAGALLGHAVAAADRVTAAGTMPLPAMRAGATVPPRDASLRFEGVTARWRPEGSPVLHDVSLDIPAGSRVALLGASGSGKSTIAALAMQVISPQSGRVTLGGTDIADLPPAELRQRVALLSQATHVFDDTIRGNLLLGRADADDGALWAALDQAALGEMVRALPQGLDTWVGESGARLSGGQARRLALARTLLSRASVLILDEPAAGLDAETERAFLSSLFGAAQGRTLILIAHRLTGVERPDRIWRLTAGHAIAAMA